MEHSQIAQMLAQGVTAAKAAHQKSASEQTRAGQRQLARQLLLQVVEADESNVLGWLWLSTVTDNRSEQVICLRNVLVLDPDNVAAKKQLARLGQDENPSSTQPAQPAHVEPVATTEAAKAAPKKAPRCPFCKKPLADSQTVCPHCEIPLVIDCPSCGMLMDVERQTCAKCGQPLGDYRLGSVYFTLLAEEYRFHHHLSWALDALRVAEKLNPNQPDLYRQMGEVLAELSEPLAAIPVLEKAIEIEPDQMGPYLALGKVLQQEGKWEDAERVYRAAMRTAPESSETYYALGNLLLQYDKLDEAKKQLQQAVKIDPQHDLAWLRLGQLYERMGQEGAAIKSYRQAQKLLPGDSLDHHLAAERLQVLDPQLPDHIARSWSTFLKQSGLPLLISVLAVIVGAVIIRAGQIHWTSLLSLVMSGVGIFLWISAYSLPKNPLICLMTGTADGLSNMENRSIVAGVGALLWLVAIILALIPL